MTNNASSVFSALFLASLGDVEQKKKRLSQETNDFRLGNDLERPSCAFPMVCASDNGQRAEPESEYKYTNQIGPLSNVSE